MYCPRCREDYGDFQSLCPNCFGELRAGSLQGQKEPSLSEMAAQSLDRLLSTSPQMQIPSVDLGGLSTALETGGTGVLAGALDSSSSALDSSSSALVASSSALDSSSSALGASSGALDSSSGAVVASSSALDSSSSALGASSGALDSSAGALQSESGRLDQGAVLAPTLTQAGRQAFEEARRMARQASERTTRMLAAGQGDLKALLEAISQEMQATARQTREEVAAAMGRGPAGVREALDLLATRRRELRERVSGHLKEARALLDQRAPAMSEEELREAKSQINRFKAQVGSFLVGLQQELETRDRALAQEIRKTAEEARQTMQTVSSSAEEVADTAKSTLKGCVAAMAALSSLVIPGLGQIFLLRFPMAIVMFGLLLLVYASDSTFLQVALRIWAAVDAWKAAQRSKVL